MSARCSPCSRSITFLSVVSKGWQPFPGLKFRAGTKTADSLRRMDIVRSAAGGLEGMHIGFSK